MEDWTAASNMVFGIATSKVHGVNARARNPDYCNYDFSLVKKFEKFEVGGLGFGTTDFAAPRGYQAKTELALGSLVGYDFGAFSINAYVPRSVATSGGLAHETRGWLRLVAPLGIPAPANSVAPTRF